MKFVVIQVAALFLSCFVVYGAGARPNISKPKVVKPAKVTVSNRPHHAKLWDTLKIRSDWNGKVSKTIVRINAYKWRYQKVSKQVKVPWEILAALHNMESTGSFSKHLHEGSPLSNRTRWVPKGRPKIGKPPFTWEESAYDAIYRLKRMDRFNWSDIGEALYRCELYNGAGYMKYHKDVNSPYLWSGSHHYTSGKYVSDGKWSQTAKSSQVGVALILYKLGYPNK